MLGECHTARDTDNHKGLSSKPGAHQYHLAEVQPIPFLPFPPFEVQNNSLHTLNAICQDCAAFQALAHLITPYQVEFIVPILQMTRGVCGTVGNCLNTSRLLLLCQMLCLGGMVTPWIGLSEFCRYLAFCHNYVPKINILALKFHFPDSLSHQVEGRRSVAAA